MKKQTEYRIITEDLQREKIVKIVSYHFPGFSITDSIGFWKTVQENSITVSIIANNTRKNRLTIKAIAGQIRDINSQQCVLITENTIIVEYI